MSDGPLAIGSLLDGRYRIDALIGRGGMGVVYRGTDLTLRRPVAIKVLEARGADDSALARFLGEAQTLAQLEHRSLVPIYAVGRTGDLYYMVMKLLEGQTLAEILKQRAPLSPDEVGRLVVAVCDALGALHKAGLVHRDVKPANIMVGVDGRVTVMDLGIASPKGIAEATLQAVGTPRYMAPEMLGTAEVDGRADVYALGVVAYHALTGQVPFDGPTPMAVLYKHAHEPVEPIRKRAPQVPRAIAAAVELALAKNPAQRYPTTAHFAEAVQQALAGRGGGAGFWVVVGTLVGIAAAAAVWLLREPDPGPVAAEADMRKPRYLRLDAELDAAPPPKDAAVPDAAPDAERRKPPKSNGDRLPPDRPPVPPTEAPPTAAPAVAQVSIRIISTPPGATVKEGGAVLGTTPLTIQRPAGSRTLTVSLSKAGYDATTGRISLSKDGVLRVTLESGFELVP